MTTESEYREVMAEIIGRRRLAEPAKQDRPTFKENHMLSDAEIKRTIDAAVRPLHEKTAEVLAENTNLRHRLGLFTEAEERAHTATYLTAGAELAEHMVGPSLSKKSGASKKQRQAREAAHAVMAFGRSAIRANNWRL